MIVFPYTSFICPLYRKQHTSLQAVAFQETLPEPLPVSTLLLLEFRQSIRLQARLFVQDPNKGFPKNEGSAMLRAIQSDLAGGVLQMAAPDWADVHRIAGELSAKHAESGGHRLADILHVASTIHLGAEQFLTFVVNQRKLAEAEGMVVPL